MPNKMVLAWTVGTSNTPVGPAGAATRLAAVPLYASAQADPVLGAMFGLTVDDDATTTGATTATRTLTLNLNGSAAPEAPPPFPCRPITSTPPVPPYRLIRTEPVPGSYYLTQGSNLVPSTEQPFPWAQVGMLIRFLSQPGVAYEIAGIGPTGISLTSNYTGTPGNFGAFRELAAPVTIAAIFSTSELDTAGVATVPAITAGSGAREVEVHYLDSTGADFISTVALTGKRPAAVPLAGGSVDIAEIVNIIVTDTGDFENSVGQITLVELAEALPTLPPETPPGDPENYFEGVSWISLTDEAQLLVTRALAYIPPSFFALSQQGASVESTVAPPSNAELSGSLGESIQLTTAGPPADPPLTPVSIPPATFVSGYLTRTLQLALAGTPIAPAVISFV